MTPIGQHGAANAHEDNLVPASMEVSYYRGVNVFQTRLCRENRDLSQSKEPTRKPTDRSQQNVSNGTPIVVSSAAIVEILIRIWKYSHSDSYLQVLRYAELRGHEFIRTLGMYTKANGTPLDR